jgi:hypothetical protein
MLLPTDSAAIQGSRLTPNAQAALNSTLSVRAATLVRPQYFKYTGATTVDVVSYDFPPNTISVGTQVFIHLYGSVLNTDVGDIDFAPILASTNNSLSADSVISVAWQTPPQAGSSAWVLDATLSANPAADPDFTAPPFFSTSAAPSATTLRWSGMLSLTQTDITATGAGTNAIAGGNPLSGAGANRSLLVSTTGVAPLVTFLPNATTRVSLSMTIGALGEFTVQGGWLEVR